MQLGFSFCLVSAFRSSASSHITGPQQFHSFKTSPPVRALAPVQQISSAQGEGAEPGLQPITTSNPRDGRRRLFFPPVPPSSVPATLHQQPSPNHAACRSLTPPAHSPTRLGAFSNTAVSQSLTSAD